MSTLSTLILDSLADAPWWVWPTAIVALVLAALAAVWWVLRAARRGLASRRARLHERAAGDTDRLRALRQVRQQITMDRLIAVQFIVAMSFSAYGIAEAARVHAGIPVPLNWAIFAVFEGFALVIMQMINQRADKALRPGALGAIYWLVMGLAAGFNATHASNPIGAAFWAAITLLAASSYALRMAAKRRGREEELRAAAGRAASRRLALVRWLHPIERIHVALEMARDEALGADEATRAVRERVAERREQAALARVRTAVWRLRRAQTEPRPKEKGRRARRADLAERRAEHAAQQAIADARMATDSGRVAAVLRELQMMALAPAWAAMDYSTPDEARRTMQRLITPEALDPLALPAAAADRTEPEPETAPRKRRTEPATGGNVTPMRVRLTDEELETKGRAVLSAEPGITVADFRDRLGVGMRRAHPLLVRLREEEATG